MPTDDAFAGGSPAYGSQVIGYLGLRPTSDYARGRLFDGHQVGKASMRRDAASTYTACGAMRRQVFPEDVEVSLTVRLLPITGAPTSQHFGRAGVFARVQGGTLAGDGTREVRYEDVDCYGFTVERSGAVNLAFRLVRIVNGVVTNLDSEGLSAADVGHFGQDVTITLRVVQDGSGDPVLTGNVTQVNLTPNDLQVAHQAGGTGQLLLGGPGVGGGTVTNKGTPLKRPGTFTPKAHAWEIAAEAALNQWTDTAGAQITGTGRCGFAMDHEVDHGGGITTTMLCSAFQVAEIVDGAPVVRWRDEWTRVARTLAHGLTDSLGFTGRMLGCDYTTDGASNASPVLSRNAGDDAAEMASQITFGQGVSFNSHLDELVIADALAVFPPAPSAAALGVTVACWMRLDDEEVEHSIFNALDRLSSTGIWQGMQFSVQPGTLASIFMRARLGGQATPTDYSTAEFSSAQIKGNRWRFVFTYRANANTGTGEGRLRFYIGRQGTATLLGELTVAAADRPELFKATDATEVSMGPSDEGGIFDGLSVFYEELTPFAVSAICDEFASLTLEQQLGLVFHCNFEDDDGMEPPTFTPTIPAGITDDDGKLAGTFTTAVETPGLVPVQISPIIAWARRPADDPRSQHRSIRVRAGAQGSVAGVALRGTPLGADPTLYDAYRLDVSPGAPAIIRLVRVRAGVETEIAHQSGTTGTVDIAVGSYHKLELRVFQLNGVAQVTGPVALEVVIDDVPLALSTSGAPGIALSTDGYVIDSSDDRILSGEVEGFHTLVDTVTTRIDDWVQESGAPAAPAEAAVNYPVPAEDEAATGDLLEVLTPAWVVEPRFAPPRSEVPFDAPYRNRIMLGSYEPRAFRFGTTLVEAEKDALQAFWDEHEGPVVPFAFDPSGFLPSQQAGVFAFVEGSLVVERRDRQWFVEFEIEECRASPASA